MAQRLFLAIVGLFFVFSTGCASRGFIRDELNQGLGKVSAETATMNARLAAVEQRQAGLQAAVASGFGLVDKSLEALV